MPGLFITFEGGEGTGKSTQLERLARRIRSFGIEPLITREPGGTPLAESIRALLLSTGARPPGPLAEALLMVAARADLVETTIRPALDQGRVVICDRYADSTLAYQGGGRGIDLETLRSWNRVATGGLIPDLTLLLDLDPAVGGSRRAAEAGEATRLDREPAEFHRRVRACYLGLAAAERHRFVVVDASKPPDAVAERIWTDVEPRLPRS